MPSSATITSFYNFSANTKARASQVNNNFDVFRGHIIPVEIATATSSDNNYDLGSYQHRWRNAYLGSSIYGATTSTYGSMQLASDTTAAELILSLNGTEKARVNTNGIKLSSLANKMTVSSSFSFILGGVLDGTVTTTVSGIDTTRPVSISFVRDNQTTSSGDIRIGVAFTSAADGAIYLKRDSTVINAILASITSSQTYVFPLSALNCIDTSATASSTYHIVCTGTSGIGISLARARMIITQ